MTRSPPGFLALIISLPILAAEPSPTPEICRTVALHPVVVNGTDASADKAMISEIQAVAAAELLKRQRTLQDSSVVADALSKLPNNECADNECLSKLARDTKSDCTAYFAVTPNAGRSVFLSARLIPSSSADRPVFSRSEHYDRVGKTPRDWAISALQRFIRTVPLADPTAVEPLPLLPNGDDPKNPPDGQGTANITPPPPPTSSAPITPPVAFDWRMPVGIGAAVAGVGAAVAGTIVYNQADAGWRALLESAGGVPFPASRTEELRAAHRSASANMQLGSAGIIGGAALAAGGAGLLLWQLLAPQAQTPEQGTTVACGLTVGSDRSVRTIHCSFSLP